MGARRALAVGLATALVASFLIVTSSVEAAPARSASGSRSWSRLAAETWLERAENLLARGETIAAVTAYTQALRADPTFGQPYIGLARVRRLQGDLREAEWLLTRATSLPDVRADAHTERAELFAATGRAVEALDDRRAAAEADPSPIRLRALAASYAERRAWVAALCVWRRLRAELARSAVEAELRDAEETIAALAILAAETDGVQHDMGDRDWVRRALRRQARD